VKENSLYSLFAEDLFEVITPQYGKYLLKGLGTKEEDDIWFKRVMETMTPRIKQGSSKNTNQKLIL
jgi:hypothetical protein